MIDREGPTSTTGVLRKLGATHLNETGETKEDIAKARKDIAKGRNKNLLGFSRNHLGVIIHEIHKAGHKEERRIGIKGETT